MKISVKDYEDYLYDHYKNHGIDTSLFMKLVEEVGEVAEVLNKRDGSKIRKGDNKMKCPECGNELKKGVIEAKDAGSFTQSLTMLTWYPEEYKGKLVKKNTINLRLKTDGCARKIELKLAGLVKAFLPLKVAAEREGLFDYPGLFVAEKGSEVVGFAACTEDELAWLYVDPEYMRRGSDR